MRGAAKADHGSDEPEAASIDGGEGSSREGPNGGGVMGDEGVGVLQNRRGGKEEVNACSPFVVLSLYGEDQREVEKG